MTEKRFQIDDDGDISEFENQQWIGCWEYGNGKHWDDLCNKLNQLYDENEWLKEGLEDHRKMHEKWKEEALDNSKKVTIICTEEDIIKKLKGDME